MTERTNLTATLNDCRRLLAMLAGTVETMSRESDSYELSGVAVCLNRIGGELEEVELAMEA